MGEAIRATFTGAIAATIHTMARPAGSSPEEILRRAIEAYPADFDVPEPRARAVAQARARGS